MPHTPIPNGDQPGTMPDGTRYRPTTDVEPRPTDAETRPTDVESRPTDVEPGPTDVETRLVDAKPRLPDATPRNVDADPGPDQNRARKGPSRRTVLAVAGSLAVGGLTALAGCLEDSLAATDTPVQEDVELLEEDVDGEPQQPFEGGEPDDLNPDTPPGSIPVAEETLPLEYDLARLQDELVSGGVGQDGIPSIDDPSYENPEFSPLEDGDPVFGVVVDGEAVAFPQRVLVWHEIVNDRIGDTDVCITYCPLTGTAQGHLSGGVEFGVSGQLANSNLVMYDRESESYWPQMLATAISGPYAGHSLEEIPVHWVAWGDWVDAYPDSRVLTEDTGFARDYGNDPYGAYNPLRGYYTEDTDVMFAPISTDERLPPKRMVLGARPPDGPFAIDRERLRHDGVVEIENRETDYVAVADPVFQTGHVYHNPEGQTFTWEDDGVVDEDGTHHDPGELPLERVDAYDAMWFAWAGYYPSTSVTV